MFCEHCGNEISDNAKFCKNCGAKINGSEKNNSVIATAVKNAGPKNNNSMARKSFEVERQEAIVAGERALESLQNAKRYMHKARNWGVVDILGGGMITSAIKHSNIDNAQMELEQAKNDLVSFAEELRDIDFQAQGLEFGNLLSLVDVFCDNVFADVMVQHRILKSETQLNKAIKQIEDILEELEEIEYNEDYETEEDIEDEIETGSEEQIGEYEENTDEVDQYICLIQELRDQVQDDEMIKCLDGIENSVNRILAKVKKHPELEENSSVGKMRNNYIPQTTKLIELYLDETTSERAKKEISDTLKTSANVYENIDKELSDKADVKTLAEIEILKSSFSRDGIVDPELEIDIEE